MSRYEAFIRVLLAYTKACKEGGQNSWHKYQRTIKPIAKQLGTDTIHLTDWVLELDRKYNSNLAKIKEVLE